MRMARQKKNTKRENETTKYVGNIKKHVALEATTPTQCTIPIRGRRLTRFTRALTSSDYKTYYKEIPTKFNPNILNQNTTPIMTKINDLRIQNNIIMLRNDRILQTIQ